jgi:hypothetical protein
MTSFRRLTNVTGNTETILLARLEWPRQLRPNLTTPPERPRIMTDIKVRTRATPTPIQTPNLRERARKRRSIRGIRLKVSRKSLTWWKSSVRTVNSPSRNASTTKITTCAYSVARLDIECVNAHNLPWPELRRRPMGRLLSRRLKLRPRLPSRKNSQRPFGLSAFRGSC